VVQRGEDITGEGVDGGDGPRSALDGVGRTLTLDPAPDPVGEIADDAGIIDMPMAG
jgi:hypothetical protein